MFSYCFLFSANVISFVTFAGLEESNSDKSKCQEHFDIYKECKKKEVSVLLDTEFPYINIYF